MKKNVRRHLPFVMYLLLVSIVCLSLSIGSCAFTSEAVTMITGDYVSPRLDTFMLSGENSAQINFTHDVTFPLLEYYDLGTYTGENNNFISEIEDGTYTGARLLGNVSFEKETEGFRASDELHTYRLTFPYKTEAQLQYILLGTVKDSIGSTLTFTIGFSGYNARVPHVLISEVSTEYSKPRTEFVELYILEDGNLAGIILESASDGIEKNYIFPAVEVKKGEYVVVHMRTIEEGAVNELGSDTSLSVSKQSSIEGRDLWISSTDTRLSKNDVLLLRKRLNGELLDALVYTDGVKDSWPKDEMFTYVQEAVESNVWQGGLESSSAINIEKITSTRTLSRQNIQEIAVEFDSGKRIFENSKENWIIVASSNASPGKDNSTNPYVQK